MRLNFFLSSLIVILLFPFIVRAAEPVELALFWANGCPHCAAEKEWFKELQPQYGEQLIIKQYEVSAPGSRQVLEFYQNKLGFTLTAVPVTIVGDWHIIGFDKPETTGARIKAQLDQALGDKGDEPTDKQVNVPFWGAVNLSVLSLPAVTAVLGLLD